MKDLKVGLQLYSIRQAMTEDMDSALAQVKAIGYDYVEFSGGRYGRTAAETRALLDKHGLICVSVHQSPSFFENDPADAVDYVKTLGAKFCAIPICRLDDYVANRVGKFSLFAKMAEAFARENITLLYHNHAHELTSLPGDDVVLLDRILEEIPGLQPEFDTCWLSYGGKDPVSYIKKYANRADIVHLKDYRCDALPQKPVWQLSEEGYAMPQKRSEAGFSYQPIGEGVENWGRILDAVNLSSARYVVVEQDESKERSPLEAARMSREYLRRSFGL